MRKTTLIVTFLLALSIVTVMSFIVVSIIDFISARVIVKENPVLIKENEAMKQYTIECGCFEKN